MKGKWFYMLVGLVIGITFILIIGAKPAKVCWLNKGGQYHLGSAQEPRDDQQVVDMKYCLGNDKQDPTATERPKNPTATLERPTATDEIEETPTPRQPRIIITDPPHGPTATATRRIDPSATATQRATQTATATVDWTGPKVDQDLPGPTATPCPGCSPCPDIRCSLATIAAAQATQANWITNP